MDTVHVVLPWAVKMGGASMRRGGGGCSGKVAGREKESQSLLHGGPALPCPPGGRGDTQSPVRALLSWRRNRQQLWDNVVDGSKH